MASSASIRVPFFVSVQCKRSSVIKMFVKTAQNYTKLAQMFLSNRVNFKVSVSCIWARKQEESNFHFSKLISSPKVVSGE